MGVTPTGAATTQVGETTVDGVPVFWLDAPPPFRAALTFRVGRIDETLATTGTAHLVEHLTLSDLFDRTYGLNGFVATMRTTFHMGGTDADAVDFLAHVCKRLSAIDVTRFDVERRILRAEAAGMVASAVGTHLGYRYGPTGAGLPAYPELGLYRTTVEDLRGFGQWFFNRSNAVLVMTGPPPAGLRLPLGDGDRRPLPVSTPVPMPYPAWFAGERPDVTMSFVGPRTMAHKLAVRMVERRLFQRLRLEAGVSYGPASAYEPIGGDVAMSLLACDALSGHEQQAVDLFVETLDQVNRQGFEPADLEHERATWLTATDDVDVAIARMDGEAFDMLTGCRRDDEPLQAKALRVQLDEASAAFASLHRTGLLLVPPDCTVTNAHVQPGPLWSPAVVRGHEVLPAPGDCPADAPDTRLLLADEGITLQFDHMRRVTVRWNACHGAVIRNDGAWVLHGGDGFRLVVDPSRWRSPETVLQAMERHVPHHLRIVLVTDAPPAPAPPSAAADPLPPAPITRAMRDSFSTAAAPAPSRRQAAVDSITGLGVASTIGIAVAVAAAAIVTVALGLAIVEQVTRGKLLLVGGSANVTIVLARLLFRRLR